MSITAEEFSLIRDFVHEHSGILINDGKEYLVENRLTVLMVQNGCRDFVSFHNKLVADKGPLRAKVIDAMTTNETLWFRDASFFSALSDFVIPQLVKKASQQRVIRIWSAASSTGQEPYSVAMLIDHCCRKMGPKAPPLDRFKILATDISSSALFIANTGRYSQLAISRGMRKAFLDRYFINRGMAFEVNNTIKSMVQFKLFNLKSNFNALGTFDFILCRNVLIYFSNQLKQQIYSQMAKCMNKDGLLAIGASESPRGYTNDFEQVMIGGAALFSLRGSGGAKMAQPAMRSRSRPARQNPAPQQQQPLQRQTARQPIQRQATPRQPVQPTSRTQQPVQRQPVQRTSPGQSNASRPAATQTEPRTALTQQRNVGSGPRAAAKTYLKSSSRTTVKRAQDEHTPQRDQKNTNTGKLPTRSPSNRMGNDRQ
ncbi:CheR family methyltransferase [Magnetococcales bacterium HHB-1]